MISIEPYSATYAVNYSHGDGIRTEWEPCRVLGITIQSDGQPAYVIQIGHGGETWLETTGVVRPQH